MKKKSALVRDCRRKILIFIFVAVSGLVFISSFITVFSSFPSTPITSTIVQSTNTVLHSLPATYVRLEHPDLASNRSSVQLVLSIDTADLIDFVDAYSRGFATEPVQYPDDGGILLHNTELCRGHQLHWVVYVHTSPGHRLQRQMMRYTWANVDLFKSLNFRVVFLLGKPPPDSPALQVTRRHGRKTRKSRGNREV